MIRIGFSTRNDNPISPIVRWITRSKCSHVWLLVDKPEGAVVLQAGHELVETPWDWFKSEQSGNVITDIYDSPVPLDAAVTKAEVWLGQKYDVAGMLGMAFVVISRWFKVKWHNPLQNSKQLFCSELVAKVLKEAGYPGTEDMDPSSVSPQDLLELVSKPT